MKEKAPLTPRHPTHSGTCTAVDLDNGGVSNVSNEGCLERGYCLRAKS